MNAPPATLSASELQRICEFLYQRTGMSFGEAKRYYIERRVADRIRLTASGDFPRYFNKLRADPSEVEEVINAFTVNETYFYREEHQLRALGRSILPEIIRTKGPGERIRIWSAPCSSGEEPYSIALWLLENWPLVDAYNIEIVGSDIDTDILDAAREGIYSPRALSRLPTDLVEAYFEPAAGGQRQIIKDLRESVTFTAVNLMDPESVASNGRFEVIFCRNVLIYFDDAARLAAVDNLFESLHPGGYICLGHSESMSRITDRFETKRFPDGVVYRRPEQG